jgi:gliding motility-associated-like protein
MKKAIFICMLQLGVCFVASAQNSKSVISNIQINTSSPQKVFVENKGQFDKGDGLRKSNILFAIDDRTKIYFTPNGLTYKFTKIEVEKENESEKEKKEEERKFKAEYQYAHMEWVGANANVQVVAGERSEGYYCFGSKTNAPTVITYGYKKITYKNLYPNIDVEYFFHSVEGIKYNIILHPGADPNLIQMRYSSNKGLFIDGSGNTHISVKDQEDIIDHAPVTYVQNNINQKINSNYSIDKNTVSFKLEGIDNSKTIVIDPWTTNPNFTGNNKAFNIHKDAAGNLYSSGGYNPYYLRKFSPSGAFIWNFNLPNNSNWNVDNVVDPSGNSYICYGPWIGNNTTKVSPAGVQIFNNTTANSPTSYNTGETYELTYNTSTNRLYSAGYFTGLVNIWEENPTTGSQFGHINACATTQSECRSIETDNVTGDVYTMALPLASANSSTNHLIKMDQNLNIIWDVDNGYNLTESQLTYYPHSFSQLNGLAVGCSFVYTCDGQTLKKWSKTTGALLGSPVIVPNGSIYKSSGLIVDPCGDVYVGSTTGVYKYDQNLTFISTVATPDTVYDVCIGNIAGEVIAAGKGFINSLNFGGCTSTSACFQQLSPYSFSICLGTTATLSISNPNNLLNPTYSVQPGSLTSNNSTFVVTPTVATTYSVYITGTLNSSVITQSTTISVGIYPTPSTNVALTIGTCANPVTNSVNLNVAFTPSVSTNYTLNWSPLPGNVTTVNSGTASNLAQGINNVTITASNGCSTTVSFSVPPLPQPASFVIVNPSNDYTITCINPNVALTTSITNGVPLTFTWFPACTNTLVGPSMSFTQPCTGQVVGQSSTGCLYTQTFTIYQDLTSPTIAITPTINNITCAGGSGCFTLTSNLGPNVTTNWYQIVGTNTVYVGAAQGTLNIFCAGNPGVYWGESVYNLTGCRITKSVQVTASVGVPIFTVTSPTNFTIGCGTKSVTSMQVTNVITSPTLNTPCSYTFMVPPVSSTPTTFSAQPNLNNITVPGIYVVYVKDQSNNCISSQSVNIIQNVIPPNLNFIQPLSLLTCRDASMVLTGISSNTNTNISWTVPAIPSPSVNPTPNATVYINPAITGATNAITSIGVWTVGAIDNNNFCVSTKTVQILQDIRLPKFTISAQSNSVITCANSDVLIIPIVTNSLAVALVPTFVWYPPVGQALPGTSFNTTVPGTHTSIATSAINGCTYSATYVVAIDVTLPDIQIQTTPFILDCNANPTVVLSPVINTSTTGLTYTWTVPAGALTSNLHALNLTSNVTGVYVLAVTNTLNGCSAQAAFQVTEGGIKADFIADPQSGFSPLSVTFTNTSSTSTSSTNINSTWGFGNGQTYKNITNTVLTSATYSAPGTYSVVLIVQKGTCIATAIKTIEVLPASEMVIPNVFTPNGDGANDIFRLRASSLAEISIMIYDRWGTKVYDVVSDTGNFAWDGTNQYGKKCADGVYYYVLKAKGKDDKEFEHKGNVSLFR